MRIISHFRDYYDGCAIDWWNEDRVNYIREKYTVESEELRSLYSSYSRGNSIEIHPLAVFFCGEIFPVLRFDYRDINHETIVEYFYSVDALKEFLSRTELDDWLLKDLNKPGKKAFFSPGRAILDFFKESKKHKKTLRNFKTPIVILIPDIGVQRKKYLNLEDIKFYRIYANVEAYGKINQYLTNELAVENQPPVKIEDKYLIEQKGFDIKASFRKDKDQRKRKQK